MKRLIVMALMGCVAPLLAEQVEVTADKFFADEKKKISVFEGNVKVVKQSDKLLAQKVLIEFDDKKQPLQHNLLFIFYMSG